MARFSKEYLAYLRSPQWAQIKAKVKARCGGRCESCGRNGPIDVHHKTYKRLFNEDLNDLVGLCRSCHDKEHGYGVGGKIIPPGKKGVKRRKNRSGWKRVTGTKQEVAIKLAKVNRDIKQMRAKKHSMNYNEWNASMEKLLIYQQSVYKKLRSMR